MITPTTLSIVDEHPFAPYIRILGKGKLGSRSLSYDEAYNAFSMILRGEVLDIQIGAFLMLLRVKAESVDEMAGFVQACKDHLQLPPLSVHVDVDWSSYAGKRKHYPWFLLAALTLSQHGLNVVMHGAAGHTTHRLYTENALAMLNVPCCQHINEISAQLNSRHFAYIPLSVLLPRLSQMIDYRSMLGLRSPVHSLVRLLNPFDATSTLQAIFHPAYREIHQQSAFRLGYQNSAVIKGEGGEFERNPDAKTLICGIRNGTCYQLELPKLTEGRSDAETVFDPNLFKGVWEGSIEHAYGLEAIIETLTIVLMTLHQNTDHMAMRSLALHLWHTRFNNADQHPAITSD